ncbi:MAG: SAM-dependent methyltransferase [Bacteroidales bacterium]|nr:SAM-dependent methyltransferase [Bacteroidales bacterium]
MTHQSPRLYLFPVPLAEGAPADVLPARNLELLKQIRYFAVENLRSARRFLRAVSHDIVIDELSLVELNEHTDPADVAAMLAPMQEGHDMGVISEAGCPAVADPGADLVAVAQRRGYEVVPLVGPSSILMSLMGSGFNGQSFTFLGYLPVEAGRRNAMLREIERDIRRNRRTQIFIETPYRNNRLIDELVRALPGDMLLCVASDITGPRQSIVTAPLSRWAKGGYDYSKIPTIFLLYS